MNSVTQEDLNMLDILQISLGDTGVPDIKPLGI